MNAAAYNRLLDSFLPETAESPAGEEVARGELGFESGAALLSPLSDVSDDAWAGFVRTMATGALGAVTSHNALGLFELSPRRLADLGYLSKRHLKRRKSAAGKTIWTSVFVPPLTSDQFLSSPWLQYRAFTESMRDYASRMAAGVIEVPEGMSRAGALAVLHRAGPGGLSSWARGKRLPATERLLSAVEGIF